MAAHRYYSIDRIEGTEDGRRRIMLVDDDGSTVDLPESAFSLRPREGWVLVVPMAAGVPDWSRAARDAAEENRRLAKGRAAMARMRATDRGGDVTL